MKINLLRSTEKPETMVAVAARLCYSPIGVNELLEEIGEKEINKLVRFVIKSGHLSTTEHISFTFAIEGVSRALTHQLVRHRVASYNQQSQRYVSFRDNFEYIVPPQIKKDGEFVEVEWDEALDFAASKLRSIKEEHGPDAIGFLASAKVSNEENYLLQKFARAAVGTNSVDHCARL